MGSLQHSEKLGTQGEGEALQHSEQLGTQGEGGVLAA